MKTIITILFSVILIQNSLVAQQQMLNPGFEDWEDAGTVVDEPTHWSSIKTSDDPTLNQYAPLVWEKSTDAHSGNYSVGLFNVGTLGIVASGMVTNGRVHPNMNPELAFVFTDENDDSWHGVLTERPDSIVGWYKCNPVLNDFGTVKFMLHTGYGQLPGDESNKIAEAYYELPAEDVTEWTRFSIPFDYTSSDNPEYFLAILTSGNGTQALPGSTALFDDLEFIYNASSVYEVTDDQLKVIISNDNIQFIFENNTNQIYQIKLIDINGRTVLTDQLVGKKSNSFDISKLQSGIYIAVATNSEKTITKKIHIK